MMGRLKFHTTRTKQANFQYLSEKGTALYFNEFSNTIYTRTDFIGFNTIIISTTFSSNKTPCIIRTLTSWVELICSRNFQFQKNIKNMMDFQALIPGLPDDIALECLIRIQTTDYLAATGVCSRWRCLLRSREFTRLRKQSGLTRFYACLVQAKLETTGSKPASPSHFGISVFDSVTREWNRVDSPPLYPTRLPLFCQVAGSEGKLVLMGGWDPESYEPVTRVLLYDFLTRKWKQGKDMPSKRSFFAIGGLNGRIYVAGGHDPDKNGLNSACVYDIMKDEWAELPPMSQVRDECQGLVIGSEFWVISGYGTNNQGEFKSSAETYDVNSGSWTRAEDVWSGGQSPRSCAGSGKNRELINWAESNSEFRVGTCAVELDDQVLVSGSVSEGASRGFYLGKMQTNGKYGDIEKLVNVPHDFCGFVQSGCYVEV